MEITKEKILLWLEAVKDPEIPVLSLVDLGVITNIEIDDDSVAIELTPTFVGCPALEAMKSEIIEVLRSHDVKNALVKVSYRIPWSSDLISDKGKAALKKFGLAPPAQGIIFADLDVLPHAQCPRCDGENTEQRNAFGPTLCRSIHYCFDCQEAFEQFKSL